MKHAMLVRAFKYKLMGTATQYGSCREIRYHLMRLRNACLQEWKDSYRAACREASRHGRDKPNGDDWIVVRAPEIRDFLVWQNGKESDLRRRHDQKQRKRAAKEIEAALKDGRAPDPKKLAQTEWKPKTERDFGYGIVKSDWYRRIDEIRKADPDGIGRVPVTMLREAIDIVATAIDRFYERVKEGARKPGFPRFKNLARVRSFAAPIGNGLSFDPRTKRLTSGFWIGGIKVNMHRPLPAGAVIRRLVVRYDGRFYRLSVQCQIPERPLPKTGQSCGVDVGVENYLALDDGTMVENPRFGRAAQPEIRRKSRKLARCKQGSNGRRKAAKAVARDKRRVAQRRDTFQHTEAKKLVSSFDRMVFELLGYEKMTRSASGTIEAPGTNVAQKRGLNRSMRDAAHSAFIGKTIDKAESAGREVVFVNPHNTSQECSGCHAIVRKTLKVRVHDCPQCGMKIHRDTNSAIVIRRRGDLLQAA